MTSLPPHASALQSKELLNQALSTLFEPSEPLTTILVPQLFPILQSASSPPTSYSELIDIASKQLHTLPPLSRALFIDSHPRIGEVKALSALSAKEQASVATPPNVLARLEHLNAMYETRFTGLKYVVFVDGRSRAEIVPLIEEKLGIGPSKDGQEREPPVESVVPLDVGDEEWELELERAIGDVALIAKARLKALGAE